MNYQIIVKQYKGSVPVKEERWNMENTGEQIKNLEQFPMNLRFTERGDSLIVEAEMLQKFTEPVSVSLEYEKENWKKTEYVFFPAAVYNGNRMESKKIPYPPYHAGKTDGNWDMVITDIPHLDREKDSQISFRSGDMSTPAMGYYDEEKKEGEFLLASHEINGQYTGFSVKEKDGSAFFSVSVPAVREEKKYFFGELPDGSGFFPTCEADSDDEGMVMRQGERVCLVVRKHIIQAESVSSYIKGCNALREELETGNEFTGIPFSKAYDAVKEKYIQYNFTEEGYYRVGTENEAPPSFWQAGWVGGGMNTCSFIREDKGTAREQALSTLRFIAEHLQMENGWYVPMYAKGKRYGDNFQDDGSEIVLVRKNGDLLYFLMKQIMELKTQESVSDDLTELLEGSAEKQADAFVRFFRKNGDMGQFADTEKEELLQGGTACGAIIPAALALAYEYFRKEEYLETAEDLGYIYYETCLKKGILNGGPGEICQAPDSESAFAFLESCVQLYETTGKEKWLTAADEAFELAITWVMSYDFHMPKESTAAKLHVHTAGTVFANAQNKHSAPGICTLSGNSMLKLYRFTGNEKYLFWMKRISHALSQFVSLKDRPVYTLEDKNLPSGYFNERVQTSDWEGKETIGEFLYGSNWPEVTMLLTYTEIPGIYVNADKRKVWCADHVKAEIEEVREEEVVLKIQNPSAYDARINVLAERDCKEKLGHLYYKDMVMVSVGAGQEKIFTCGIRKTEEL